MQGFPSKIPSFPTRYYFFHCHLCSRLHPLDGEVGFVYQNLPLRKTDKESGKSIALKAPYRDGGEFEISICPLPLCTFTESEEQKDCAKIDIQIPFSDTIDPEKLQKMALTKVIDCQNPTTKTSKLRAIFIERKKLVLNFEVYNGTFDSVTVSKAEGPWIATYLCPSSFYENLDAVQTSGTRKEGSLNLDECFLAEKGNEDWTMMAVTFVLAAVLLVALFLYFKDKFCRHVKTFYHRRPCNVTYNDSEEARCKLKTVLV